MSLSRLDARFLLPKAIDSAMVLGDLEAWEEGLAQVGIGLLEPGDPAVPDVAIAMGQDLEPAVRSRAECILLEGRTDTRKLERHGFTVQRFLAVPDLIAPSVFIPLHDVLAGPAVARFSASSRLKKVRNQLVRLLLARGISPSARRTVTIAARGGEQPFMISAAEHLGVPQNIHPLLILGQTDLLARCVFLLFDDPQGEPVLALKFVRTPGQAETFEAEESGLQAAAAAGPLVRRHVPRLVGRFNHHGMEASVETAAPGEQLGSVLVSRKADSVKHARIRAVADWIVGKDQATRSSPEDLVSERQRLLDELHAFPEQTVSSCIAATSAVPAVLHHGDLGAWNVMTGDPFTIIDWDGARSHGFPLWDLLYFLTDALSRVDGSYRHVDERVRHMTRLFKGELQSSSLLFEYIEKAADVLRIDKRVVGPLTTLCWLHHSTAQTSYIRRLTRHDPSAGQMSDRLADERAVTWLEEEGLGPDWDRWCG